MVRQRQERTVHDGADQVCRSLERSANTIRKWCDELASLEKDLAPKHMEATMLFRLHIKSIRAEADNLYTKRDDDE